MMISPYTYADRFEDASVEEIIKERDHLVRQLRKLEKIVLDKDKKDEAWQFCPAPDVQYQMTLGYLSEICRLLEKKYNEEYGWDYGLL